MSAETDYLAKWLTNANQLGLTFTTAQRPRGVPGPQVRWEPGVTA
ncbi:hypothetical protein EV644_14528 [Kribbella orskensis]|uniref:Uncharacterized protein n=1 Tax=Kribbella orskensis TaxID=2512216 RepID=A0ABY2B963_9ACTN|nr:hypothetical protein EV642_14828 [Kribbella sp. VKM Ac-2500]TCO08562.1 hypothetical protein EV644_14528 [Kribbella orskensis]